MTLSKSEALDAAAKLLELREGEQARVARRFADELARVLDVPVETYDERLTTRMADSTRRSGARAPQDAIAAAHLLESFLDHRAAQGARG